MNYLRIYDEMMERARLRGRPDGYFEKHHICPRSMGGDNASDNLVLLTGREHFLAHWMLWRIYQTPSTAKAWWRMACVSVGSPRYTSKNFERARVLFSDFNSGEKHYGSKKVVCLDDGRVFVSASAAGFAIGKNRSVVGEAIKNGHACGGLRFAYVGQPEPVFKTHRGMPLKPVVCVSTGVEFESCHTAGAEMGVHEHSIRVAIKRGTKSAGLFWRWK